MFEITSLKNSPGFVYSKWQDGRPMVTGMTKNTELVYNIEPRVTKYLPESDKCQKESYYECLTSRLDAGVFNECSGQCIPNTFSNLNKTYRKPFCANNADNEYCALEIINRMQEKENESECKKSCFQLEYHGEIGLYRQYPDISENWDRYFFTYYLLNKDFISMVEEEYLIYDAMSMVGSVGGTLGI